MGDAPAPTVSALDEELMAAREVARASVCFFDNVAPLARRVGIDAFPPFDTFLLRFSETEDINTHQLRADGRILQQLHTTAAAQVGYQHEQDARLVDCWPEGSGIVARQQLLAHLPRADADLTMLGELATGLLVAADGIDISRVAKFTAIGTIDANILLGMPISAWTAIVESLAGAPRRELCAAITSAINLFTSAVNVCDQAVEAILSGICTGLQGINTAAYPSGQPSDCAPVPAPEVAPGPACVDNGPAVPDASGGSASPGGSSSCGGAPAGPTSTAPMNTGPSSTAPMTTGPMSTAPTTPLSPAFDSRAASVMASGSGSVTGQFAPSLATTPGSAELTGLLGPLAGAISQVVTGAMIGIVEAVASAHSDVQNDAPAHTDPVAPPPAGTPDKESQTPGEMETKGAAATPGQDGPPDRAADDCPSDTKETGDPVAIGPAEITAPAEEPSAAHEPPPASEPEIENCPVPPGTAPGASIPTPHPARLSDPEPSTKVAPQATEQGPPAPGDEGVLALAGDQ